jgi:hypothetical protein
MSIYTNSASSTPEETAAYVGGILGLLGNQDPVDVLRNTPLALAQLLDATPAQILSVPEAPGKWAIRDVFGHLADSELVGGVRLRMVLAHDRPTIIGYDQDLWSDRLRYREVDVHEALEQFTVLRRSNLRLWANLTPSDLLRVGVHNERGEESLGHMRNLYAGHDILHLNQLNRIRKSVTAAS